jgi:hypothetical protein
MRSHDLGLYLALELWTAADSCLGGTRGGEGAGESKEEMEEDDEEMEEDDEQSREEELSSELSHSMREGSDSSDPKNQSPKSGFSFS